jgi:glycosyltransferase involved in cell wall biosynthesis
MNIAIDIVSTKIGGGLDYILNFLKTSDPTKHKFNKIFVFTNHSVKRLFPRKNFIQIIPLNNNDFFWFIRKNILISHYLEKKKINLFFIPSAINFIYKSKTVVMNQTLLPFRYDQIIRYFPNLFFFKLLFIRFFQEFSFRKSDGVIFLNKYGKQKVLSYTKTKDNVIIPLGIGDDKIKSLKNLKKNKNRQKKIKIIYISEVTNYKNHDLIIKNLKESTLDFVIYFVGHIYKPYFNYLKKINFSNDKFIFTGYLSSAETIKILSKTDIFLFASSVENYPVSILEGIVSRKKILSTSDQPVKKMLAKNAVYFSLDDKKDLEKKIIKVTKLNNKNNYIPSYIRVYNYNKIVEATFKYFNKILKKNKNEYNWN